MKSEYDNIEVGRVPVAQPGTQQHQVKLWITVNSSVLLL